MTSYFNHSNSVRTSRVWRGTLRGFSYCLSIVLAYTCALGETREFGDELSDAKAVELTEIYANPAQYVDQKIKITGRIDAVCPKKGCWIEVEKPETDISIRVKVEDDIVVFPAEAKGKSVVAEGFLRRIELTANQTRSWLKHAASERGEAFDETAEIEPMILYQIDGLAAAVDDLTPEIN